MTGTELSKKLEFALEIEEEYSTKVYKFYTRFVETLVPDSEVRRGVEPLIKQLETETKGHIAVVTHLLSRYSAGQVA